MQKQWVNRHCVNFLQRLKMKGHNFKMLLHLYIDSIFLMPLDVISPIHRFVKFQLVNCKFPMTSKLHMLHGVNNPCMVICNQSAKFHDCTFSRLHEPVYKLNS